MAEPSEQILFEEDDRLDQEDFFTFLSDYVRIGKDTGRVVHRRKYKDLESQQKKAIIGVMTQRALLELGHDNTYKAGPQRIADLADEDLDDIYPAIRELGQSGLLQKDDGRYYIPTEKYKQAMGKFN